MNIDKIIKESINIILVENTQAYFQQLNTSYTRIQQYRIKIRGANLKNYQNQQVLSFITHEFYNFLTSLEQALKRCIYANSINEGLEDWGFKIPHEINTGINTGIRNYYRAKRFFNGATVKNNTLNNSKINSNEKLLYLLNNVWPNIEKRFYYFNKRFNFNNICPAAVYARNEIETVIQIVKLIQGNGQQQNAQGTNP